MSSLRLARSNVPLRGRVRLPGDTLLGQQAILWAALADSPSCISGLARRADHTLLVTALRSMGVHIADTPAGLRVAGVGLSGLRMPPSALDAGDSASTLDILTALLSAQAFGTRITAQGAQAQRSLRTLIDPLRARGAHVNGRAQPTVEGPRPLSQSPISSEEGALYAPISAAPRMLGELLSEVEIDIPGGDATTKLALLISGLYARGITAISEGMLSRDHAERALVSLGVPIETLGGMTLLDTSELEPRFSGFDWQIPGDATLFAYLSAAVLSIPGSDVTFENVPLNRSRSAWLELIGGAGAALEVTPKGDLAGNEPVGEVRVMASRLRSMRVGGELAARMLDEVPALLALAPALGQRVSVRDVPAPRCILMRKAAQLARSFGAECTDYEDGFDLHPSAELHGTELSLEDPASDADLGPLALVLGQSAAGETRLTPAQRLDALYPEIVDLFRSLSAVIELEDFRP